MRSRPARRGRRRAGWMSPREWSGCSSTSRTRATRRRPARRAPGLRPRASSFDFIIVESLHHPLKLVSLDGLESALDLAQQEHLVRVVPALDEVVRRALQVECVVKAELPLVPRLVDEADLLRAVTILSRHAETSRDRGTSGAASRRRPGRSPCAASPGGRRRRSGPSRPLPWADARRRARPPASRRGGEPPPAFPPPRPPGPPHRPAPR